MTRQLLFYCEVLPVAYLVDQQTIVFYIRLQSSENIVLRVLVESFTCCIPTLFDGLIAYSLTPFDAKY